jgi:hypothetical protein
MAKERVTLMLPAGLWDQVKAQASRRHVSASELAAEGMVRVLKEEQEARREERMRAVERLLAVDLGPMGTPEELRELIAESATPRGAASVHL